MLDKEYNHSWRSFTVWEKKDKWGVFSTQDNLKDAVEALKQCKSQAQLVMIASEILVELNVEGKPVEKSLISKVMLNSDATAAIDKDYHWKPIDENTPRGVKLQLINRAAGSAVYGHYHNMKQGFTHYALLPTFAK